MVIRRASFEISAASATATVFGVLAGLGGITHGVGEVVQGNVPIDGLIVDSWTSGPIAANMGGEPGMTVLPTVLAAGVLTLVVSVATVVWAIAFVGRKRGGLVLLLLSAGMLLAGGGFGPPVMGMLAGVAGFGIEGRHGGWVRRLPAGTRRVLARAWPLLFAVGVVNGVFLVVGSVILVYAIDLNTPDLFLGSFYFAVLTLLLIVFAGASYDAQKRDLGAGPVQSRAPILKEA